LGNRNAINQLIELKVFVICSNDSATKNADFSEKIAENAEGSE